MILFNLEIRKTRGFHWVSLLILRKYSWM